MKPNISQFKMCFILFTALFFFAGCGSHIQTIERITPTSKTTESGETNPNLKLINAVNSGDLGKAKAAIDEGADLSSLTEEGLTLLIVAIRAEQYAIVDYLIQQGADPEQLTQSDEFDQSINAFEFIQSQAFDQEIKDIFVGILSKEEFDGAVLNEKLFNAILFKNKYLVSWLFEKGADPNYVQNRKHTPLIFLFKQKGVVGAEFESLKEVFEVLVSQPEIDVNKKVGRDTALRKAQQRLKTDSAYQMMVDRLIQMGATK